MSNAIDGQHVVINQDADVLTIAFANSPEPESYLLLQRSLVPTNQDKRLGLDRVYIELNEQIHSAYGGIRRAQLQGDRLFLTLDSQTASKLGSDEHLEVKVNPSDAKNLRTKLNELFADQLKLE